MTLDVKALKVEALAYQQAYEPTAEVGVAACDLLALIERLERAGAALADSDKALRGVLAYRPVRNVDETIEASKSALAALRAAGIGGGK